jgi:NADH-quinone oxidoreductase subunit L
MMNLFDTALQLSWLIPVLPAAAFLVIMAVFRASNFFSAATAIAAMAASFLLSLGVAAKALLAGFSRENPFVLKVTWFELPGLHIDMGVLVDPLSAMMIVVVTLVALLVEIYSLGYMHGDGGFPRFFAFLSLFGASMLGLVVAVNFLQMFVFWELVGLSSYLLIGYYFYKISAREAAKKAFITTRVGDFGLLLGILALQIMLGTLDFVSLDTLIPKYVKEYGDAALTVVALLIFLGPIGKSGQFPLHVWLPDAMEGPTPVSALIHAATMVVAGVYLVARAYLLFHTLPAALAAVAWVGGFTAFFAAAIALTQREIKRILAYSTVSQLGYMMLALGVGSLTASMFHLMTHAFFKALMFLAAGSVLHALHDRADIFALGGLKKHMPLTWAAMGVGVLAIAGIPPFAGFFSKDEILAAAAGVSLPLFALATVTAAMTAFYMARMFFAVFYGQPRWDEAHEHPHEGPWSMRAVLVVLAALAVTSGAAGYFFHFGEWVRFGPPHHAGIDWTIAGTSTALSVLAIGAAWLLYGDGRWSPDAVAAKAGPLYNLSFRKFYVDELYLWFDRTVVDGLGRFLAWFDVRVVDGVVNGCGRLAEAGGDRLRRLQTGQVQHYALIFFAAIFLLVVWMAAAGPAPVKAAAVWGGEGL